MSLVAPIVFAMMEEMQSGGSSDPLPGATGTAKISHFWTVIGSIAGVGSLAAAIVFYFYPAPAPAVIPSPGSSTSPTPVSSHFRHSAYYDPCLIGTWAYTPQPGGVAKLSDGRSFQVRSVNGGLRYYFRDDGTGSTEDVTEYLGTMSDGRAASYRFSGKSTFRYTAVDGKQLIYDDPEESFSAYSHVEGESITKEPSDGFTANDTYTCSRDELVITTTERIEYRLRRL